MKTLAYRGTAITSDRDRAGPVGLCRDTAAAIYVEGERSPSDLPRKSVYKDDPFSDLQAPAAGCSPCGCGGRTGIHAKLDPRRPSTTGQDRGMGGRSGHRSRRYMALPVGLLTRSGNSRSWRCAKARAALGPRFNLKHFHTMCSKQRHAAHRPRAAADEWIARNEARGCATCRTRTAPTPVATAMKPSSLWTGRRSGGSDGLRCRTRP
jgi:hypothetical protein